MNKHLTELAALSVIAATSLLRAQTPAPVSLSDVHRLKCSFTLIATGTWEKGVPAADVKPADLTLQFNAIDTQEGTAEMPATMQLGVGAPHIIVRLAEGNLHFLAMNSTGSVYMTTVFSDRESKATGKFKAVHTRHEFTEVRLTGYTSRPEQYYGYCGALDGL